MFPGRWNQGVAVVDINNDGKMDVYVCATTNPDPTLRRNMLFVNQGMMLIGESSFQGNGCSNTRLISTVTVSWRHFFDYDRDGDLDFTSLLIKNSQMFPLTTGLR